MIAEGNVYRQKNLICWYSLKASFAGYGLFSGVLCAELFRRHAVFAAEGFNKVAAIRETCFLTDIIEVEICKKQQILCFRQTYEFDVFLAGLTIQFSKGLGEVGITHMT